VVRLLTGGRGGLAPEILGSLDRRWTKVVLVDADGFGWSVAERHADHPFLRRVAAEGRLSQLTSQFPSTTSAHMTTLHTGVPVGESGIYEWFQYEPALDRLIAPLLFSYAGDDRRETLRGSGLDPAALYPRETIYERLAAAEVAAHAVQHEAITDTTFSRAMLRGAAVRPFTADDGWVAETSAAGPGYTVAYVDDVDAVGHEHGPDSDAHAAAATYVLDGLATLADLLAAGGETLLLATADHGQVRVHPATTVYVNERLPELARHLRGGDDGRPLAPAGSARDLFLHVLPGHLDDVEWLLEDLLGETAEVRPTHELMDEGVFGAAGPRLRERIGEVVVLPKAGESVWWREPGRFDMRFRGHHGGLTPAEAETFVGSVVVG